MELRPLGFGEIFDRAITLYVRNFVPFFGIVVVLIVPLAVVQYFLDVTQAPQFDRMIQILQHPGTRPPAMPSLFSSPQDLARIGAMVAVFYLLWPFALDAVAVGVARVYRGRTVEFGACYATVLRRWASILGVLFFQLFVFIAWYLGFIIVTFATILMAAVFARAWIPLGVAGGAIAFVLIAAALLLIAPIAVALSFAMYAVVIEGQNAWHAIGSGFARIFSPAEFWRACLFAIAAGGIVMGASMLVAVLVWVALFFHAVALEVILGSLLRASIAPFSIVLMAIYYFDVRIRREGLDLETALERLTAAAP